jgi:hypothetical protein
MNDKKDVEIEITFGDQSIKTTSKEPQEVARELTRVTPKKKRRGLRSRATTNRRE